MLQKVTEALLLRSSVLRQTVVYFSDIMKGTYEKHNAHADTGAPFHYRPIRLQDRSQLCI